MKNYLTIMLLAVFFSLSFTNCSKELEETEYKSKSSFTSVEEMLNDAKKEVTFISPEKVDSVLNTFEPYILLDVRTKDEHNIGYIPGSVLMPRGVLEFRIENESVWDNIGMYPPLKEDLIIVYCKVGSRATLAAASLQKLGFINVKCMEGGFNAWKEKYPESIMKIEKPETMGEIVSREVESGGC